MVKDLSLWERVSRRPAAGISTFRSSSCINCGLIEFAKRGCSEVHVSIKGIPSLNMTWLLRLSRANCGDAAIAVVTVCCWYTLDARYREGREIFESVERGKHLAS